jgi:YjjI family glycine radical enzyme
MQMEELRSLARAVVEDPTLTYRQRVQRLAALAEEALDPPAVSDDCRTALEKRVVCDMYEGNAPYRPRYLLPDYARLLREGSAFLELPPARTLDEAVTTLVCAYSQVPSITGYPVYVGDVDTLLEPFCDGVDDDTLRRTLRQLWIAIDRTCPDAFVHANLGPDDSRVARTILSLERELLQVVPNLTLRVDPQRTPDDLVRDAVTTVFACGKPHFVNHPMMVGGLGPAYGVVSCYNSLPVGGGSHTLVRLNLREAVLHHDGDTAQFLAATLPFYVELTAELMESRIRYLVERTGFYDSSWLAAEGLISLDRFGAMFGTYGLAEAVDLLLEREGRDIRYGHHRDADALGLTITRRCAELVAARPMPYCAAGGGRAFLHAQSGIDSDLGVSAGVRIPYGTEPDLYDHIACVAPMHRYFTSGVSDILHFDDTTTRNPQAVVDIIRGAFATGMRDFTFNLDSNDFVRITGYLVRKSDLAKLDHGARHASTYLGAGSVAQSHVLDRKVSRVVSHESAPRPGR